MKCFEAGFVSGNNSDMDLIKISELLDSVKKQNIDNLLWSKSGYKPTASFTMAYTENSILLKFHVIEKYFSAVYRQINDPVFKDSCVELFIAFDNQGYYNLEFNSIGTALAGYGATKYDRPLIGKHLIQHIEFYPLINTINNNGLTEWQLTLKIPFEVFERHDIKSLANRECKVNFYKCGDELPEPHFLSWNKIVNPQPDFHLPRYFGTVKFRS